MVTVNVPTGIPYFGFGVAVGVGIGVGVGGWVSQSEWAVLQTLFRRNRR